MTTRADFYAAVCKAYYSLTPSKQKGQKGQVADLYAAAFDAYYGQPERYKAKDTEKKPIIVGHSLPNEPLWLHVRMPDGNTWDYGFNSDEHARDVQEKHFPQVRGRFILGRPRNVGNLLSHIQGLIRANPDNITATKLQPRGKPPIPVDDNPIPPIVPDAEFNAPDWETDSSVPEP